jgi:hypothetical protein
VCFVFIRVYPNSKKNEEAINKKRQKKVCPVSFIVYLLLKFINRIVGNKNNIYANFFMHRNDYLILKKELEGRKKERIGYIQTIK